MSQLCDFHLTWVDARGGGKTQEAGLNLPVVPEPNSSNAFLPAATTSGSKVIPM